MKVLCVDLSNPERPDLLRPEDYISVGIVYTVTGTEEYKGRKYYYLAERPCSIDHIRVYNAWRFVPVESVLDMEKVYKTKEAISPAELTL